MFCARVNLKSDKTQKMDKQWKEEVWFGIASQEGRHLFTSGFKLLFDLSYNYSDVCQFGQISKNLTIVISLLANPLNGSMPQDRQYCISLFLTKYEESINVHGSMYQQTKILYLQHKALENLRWSSRLEIPHIDQMVCHGKTYTD